ncbi:MAG: aconitase family protein, partial [Hyphomicrobiaceae bacterium]
MIEPRTLFDKIWTSHVVATSDALLAVDRHFVHEGSHHAFAKIAARGRGVRRPDLTFGVADHYVPTRRGAGTAMDAVAAGMVAKLETNTTRHGVTLFGPTDPRQGIVHVVGPEQGLTLPGLVIVCGDSHTSTHGAFGAIAFGIGASEVAHVLATQTLWQKKPKTMRLRVDGALAPGCTAKDIALTWIARLGADAGRGHAIEYAGSAVCSLSMEGRLTLCNLSIEGGARCGLVAPDETTFAYLAGRPYAPKGAVLARAIDDWRQLPSDADAIFAKDITLDAHEIAPAVTWGTSPEHALPIDAAAPNPNTMTDPHKAEEARAALDYMGIAPGTPLDGLVIDRVFIGSCTN